MPLTYEAADVKCPFYHNSDQKRVICEGAEEGSTVHTVFRGKERCAAFKQRRCKSNYQKCRIYKMLNAKYE